MIVAEIDNNQNDFNILPAPRKLGPFLGMARKFRPSMESKSIHNLILTLTLQSIKVLGSRGGTSDGLT
jgi:hypothetical protein